MGRLVLVLLGVFAVSVFASRAADTPSLKGTWVRESMAGPTMGNQVILTFTDHRVTARFRSGGRNDARKEVWVTLEFEGEYARTDSGLLVGTIAGLNVDLSQALDMNSLGEPFGNSLTKMIGEPFCFRARVSDGALTVTDLKVPDVKIDDEHSSREMIAGFASGKYVSSPKEDVPLPKLKAAKAIPFSRTRAAQNLTAFMWLMSSPRAIFSNQAEPPVPASYDPQPVAPLPEPGQLPCMMPPALPLPSPMAMPKPVAMAPQPALMLVVPAGAMPPGVLPVACERIHNGRSESSMPGNETVIREIDLGEAGTMQVIVRMKGGNVKPMMPAPIPTMAPMRICPPETVCPTPSPVSQLPMQPPVPATLIPTAAQLLPPGSMRNLPLMPAIADAWKNATRIDGGIMK